MTSLPLLKDWDTTREGLHRAVRVIAAFRKAFSPEQPNALHLALYLREFGLTTGRLSFGEIAIDLALGDVYVSIGDELWKIDLSGHTPKSLHNALIGGLRHRGVDADIPENEDDAPFYVDSFIAQDYMRTLWLVGGAMRQIRADWFGAVTPLVVWPDGFDLSQCWFPHGAPDTRQPHLCFGFSPASAEIPRPYIYAYIAHAPQTPPDSPLPALARWHSGTWHGAVVDYDPLVHSPTPEKDITVALRGISAVLLETLDK